MSARERVMSPPMTTPALRTRSTMSTSATSRWLTSRPWRSLIASPATRDEVVGGPRTGQLELETELATLLAQVFRERGERPRALAVYEVGRVQHHLPGAARQVRVLGRQQRGCCRLFGEPRMDVLDRALCERLSLLAQTALELLAGEVRVAGRPGLGVDGDGRLSACPDGVLEGGAVRQDLDAPLGVMPKAPQGLQQYIALPLEHLMHVRLVGEDRAQPHRDHRLAGERALDHRIMGARRPLEPREVLEVAFERLGTELLERDAADQGAQRVMGQQLHA